MLQFFAIKNMAHEYLVLNNFRMQSLVSGVASVALMAVTHSNYAAFVKSEFNAVPCKLGQGEMDLTAVLKLRKSFLGGDEFVWLGDLASLCGDTGHEQVYQLLHTRMRSSHGIWTHPNN